MLKIRLGLSASSSMDATMPLLTKLQHISIPIDAASTIMNKLKKYGLTMGNDKAN